MLAEPFQDKLDDDVMRKKFDNAVFKGYFDEVYLSLI